MNTQNGNGLSSDLLTLGFPLGLSIISNMRNNNEKELDKETTQSAGMLSGNFIIEAGLSVVPLSLLMLSDINKDKSDEEKNKISK
jgi:hypothetical protein